MPDDNQQTALRLPDFRALFEAARGLFLVLLPDGPNFIVVAVSDAYLRAISKSREQIIGRSMFEIFPGEQNSTAARTIHDVRASFGRVMKTLQPDGMGVQLYAVDRSVERPWSLLNSPVLHESGELAYIIHRLEDVSEFVRPANVDSDGRSPVRTHKDWCGAESREALLVRLLEGQRQTSDPRIMMYAAAEAVGHYLQVDPTGFFEMRNGDKLISKLVGAPGGFLFSKTSSPLSGLARAICARYLPVEHWGSAMREPILSRRTPALPKSAPFR